MRLAISLLTLALVIPVASGAQTSKRARDVERFEVSGLPQTPTSDIEKDIFLFLRIHKKGDLGDASRIHAKLGQYYRQRGDLKKSEACDRMAVEAWEAASGERSPSAGASGTPPFEPQNTIARGFTYSDADLKVEHTWDFFDDGTFAHSITLLDNAGTLGPRETGWYTIQDGKMRLWQVRPRTDKSVSWQITDDGAMLDGVAMKSLK